MELAVVACVAAAYALPLLFMDYFPGLDLPWNAAIIEVQHRGDSRDFLGYFVVERRFSSYLTLHLTVDALAHVVGVVTAMQLVIFAYVIAFVMSARSLIRACGGNGILAVLAAPAAYSMVMEYGFLTYAICYPMTFWLWALIIGLFTDEAPSRRRSGLRLVAIAVVSGLIAITHPFAALVAGLGAGFLVITHVDRASWGRAGLALVGLAIGALPMVIAVLTLSDDVATAQHSRLFETATLWEKVQMQSFVAVDEAVVAAPVRLFGFIPHGWRFILAGAGLSAAVVAGYFAGRADPGSGLRRRALAYLLVVMALAYFFTPYTFEWPRTWYAAQPRLLPVLWVLGLVLLRCRPRLRRPRIATAIPSVVAGAALAVLLSTSLYPFASEAADYHRVVSESRTGVSTLGLIEQPATVDREPASPWRHFAAYVLVQRGGYVSSLPFAAPVAGNAGIISPVRLAGDAPPLQRAPPLGRSRSFDWATHGPGWDQFLIRDRDVDHRFDYFGEHSGEVELVARAGRWRLYRRR